MSNTSDRPTAEDRDKVDPNDPSTKRFFLADDEFVITKRVVKLSEDPPGDD